MACSRVAVERFSRVTLGRLRVTWAGDWIAAAVSNQHPPAPVGVKAPFDETTNLLKEGFRPGCWMLDADPVGTRPKRPLL
jgi:hypothetical protein